LGEKEDASILTLTNELISLKKHGNLRFFENKRRGKRYAVHARKKRQISAVASITAMAT